MQQVTQLTHSTCWLCGVVKYLRTEVQDHPVRGCQEPQATQRKHNSNPHS